MTDTFFKDFPEANVYRESHIQDGGLTFFMMRQNLDQFLVIQGERKLLKDLPFEGEEVSVDGASFLKCPLSANNARALRERFPFTRPVLIGKQNSYGLGDRLGNAGAAHLKVIRKTDFKPVLAQQSIRELERTNRTAQEVMDAASWAVFREGYKDGFGADGDHLKTTDDIDLMMKSGFAMFTIDPSDYVVNEALSMNDEDLQQLYKKLPWEELQDHPADFLDRKGHDSIRLKSGFELNPSHRSIMQGMVKYGRVITHTKKLADYISDNYPNKPSDLELSVDETDQPTTVFEHYLIASELSRLGVELVSLAPRFCGDFEKGIDFKGDLGQFKEEYEDHLAVAEMFGGYKLRIHSGSDKFSVYEVIGSLREGAVHVKTAGTSYLEALRTVAEADPGLFREILVFSKTRFDDDKKTYHISARPEQVPDGDSLKDEDLKKLLDDNNARQVLHVTFGSVLGGNSSKSKNMKEKLMKCLSVNETLYEQNLVSHFDKHLRPFVQKN